jgi:Fic family protein
MITIDFTGSPYSLEGTGQGVIDDVLRLDERVATLRSEGTLSEATLRSYFGDRRFEQIAESNALEGSTLSVGETQLAILRGVTITGHDPAYSRDAVALSRALDKIAELAYLPDATDIDQLREIHSLILGERMGAGIFRSDPVIIGGSAHTPPKTWAEVMSGMEAWQTWSRSNKNVPALMRGVLLHTWLTHIHPYLDGNGRTARAILNLELIRAGWPSVIIRRRDRERYLDALAESDSGGDLGPILDLVVSRAEDALRDLERAAKEQQGYDETAVRLRQRQERQLAIWNDAVKLLFALIEEASEQAFGAVGTVQTRWYGDSMQLDDFIELSQGRSVSHSWLFRIDVTVPAMGRKAFLAWTGVRSYELRGAGGVGSGPAIFWSVPDPTGYRQWIRDDAQSPGVAELALELPSVDKWIVRSRSNEVKRLSPSSVVGKVINGIEESLGT